MSSPSAFAVEVVSATLETNQAWTGQGVPLIIKLYSPGPFSGTASFDLPALPKTAFVKVGNSLVGSEEVAGESYITQRHEFMIYTQKTGEVVIPAFSIRFSGKKTFTSEPEPMEGATQELRFQSKRPPGTESMGVVISVSEMKVEQVWQPNMTTEVDAGDVIQRTITRTAEETTAMMFPAIAPSAPKGVRIYDQQPTVDDKTERGEATAYRSDTIKYQFQQAGTFTLPDMTFVWWDPKQEELKRETLRGSTVNVIAPESAAESTHDMLEDAPTAWGTVLSVVAALGVVGLLLRAPTARLISHWRTVRNRPDSRATRELHAACMSNDAAAAYAAFLTWLNAMRRTFGADAVDLVLHDVDHSVFREQLDIMSQHLFASDVDLTSWDGSDLWAAFRSFSHGLTRRSTRIQSTNLPPLNPPDPPFH
ncbi:BatD family protein [Adhaeretor mobilis]|uniref:BatD family protein n=1 Tax=Adhaeretor mobilis TaxID=1930276 RepID=UPI001C54CBF1|nr:BatD family protein [Adhaeretor mobilis]